MDVFVADLGSASSYVNAVRENQQKKTERCRDLAYHNGVVSFEGPKNDDEGQRLDENIVEHKGIGTTNNDEVDDYNDIADYDDQEVEEYRDGMDCGQDFGCVRRGAGPGERCGARGQRRGALRAKRRLREWSGPRRAATPRTMRATTARTITARAATAAGTARGPPERERRRHLGST